MAEGEGKIGIPARLIVTITASIDVQKMPAELKAKLGAVQELKDWAANFKADMENDPEFGKYCAVNISTEEVI